MTDSETGSQSIDNRQRVSSDGAIYTPELHPAVVAELRDLLAYVHPLMADSFYYAAIPHWFDQPLFTAIRAVDDQRNAGIVERLRDYYFITQLETPDAGAQRPYMVRDIERDILNRFCVLNRREIYRPAHERALRYWQTNPHDDRFLQAQTELYHLLFVDLTAGEQLLIQLYDRYAVERQLAAMERLLQTAREAAIYIRLLDGDGATRPFDSLVDYMRARLAQMRGFWAQSRQLLQQIDRDSQPRLEPYVARALGFAEAGEQRYAEAIAQYQLAIAAFDRQTDALDPQSVDADRARTLLALGQAHVRLAQQAQQRQQEPEPLEGIWRTVYGAYHLFMSLPLVVYLTWALSPAVWAPRFWPALRELDWVLGRLLAIGARQYRRADKVLDVAGDRVHSDESLIAEQEEAFLYLNIGDPYLAQQQIQQLLQQRAVPLSPYRHAVLQLGLAQALWQQRQNEQAYAVAQAAAPVLRRFEDWEQEARAEIVLGDTAAAAAQRLTHYERALSRFERLNDRFAVTQIAESIEQLIANVKNDDQLQRRAAAALPAAERHYAVRFRHPATVITQRTVVIVLFGLLLILATQFLQLEGSGSIVPDIRFQPVPLLQPLPNFEPQLSTGVAGVRSVALPESSVALGLTIAVALLYFLISTAVGIWAMTRTTPAAVQAVGRQRVVRLSNDGISVGSQQPLVPFGRLTKLTKADVRLLNDIIPDESRTIVETADGQNMVIDGHTQHYLAIQQRIADRLPPAALRDESVKFVRSRMGLLMAISALLFWLILLLSRRPEIINAPLLGTPYTIANLHPYLFLGLWLPSIWWFGVKLPYLRRLAWNGDRAPYWLAATGLLLFLLVVLSNFRAWFTVPGIYMPLTVIVALSSAALLLWQFPDRLVATAGWLRITVAAFALTASLIMGAFLFVENAVYHLTLFGNYHRNLAAALHGPEQRTDLQLAAKNYNRALAITRIPLLGISSRAATADLYANRAIARLTLGAEEEAIAPAAAVPRTTAIVVDRANAEQALADLNQAVRLQPDNPLYRLWRGFTYHSLGDLDNAATDYSAALATGWLSAEEQVQAHTALGWAALADRRRDEAFDTFSKAVDIAAVSPDLSRRGRADAYIGAGYAAYLLGRYDRAGQTWRAALQTLPQEPLAYINLGTLEWRLATLGDDISADSDNRCGDSSLEQAERRSEQAHLERALQLFATSLPLPGQTDAERAFTHRTRGQIQFLLAFCPDYDRRATLEAAASSYVEAINLQPQNAAYHDRRGFLEYSAWCVSDLSGAAARTRLAADGLPALAQAVALAPDEEAYAWRYNIVYAEVVTGSIKQGDRLFANGQIATAAAYYELVAATTPDVAARLRAGFTALLQGDSARALNWYQDGIAAAQSNGNPAAVIEAWLWLQNGARQGQFTLPPPIAALFRNSGIDLNRPPPDPNRFEAHRSAC